LYSTTANELKTTDWLCQ